MQIHAYLHFHGTCREAFEFYAQALGGRVAMSSTYDDAPPEGRMPGMEGKIMHTTLVADGAVLHGSDAPPQWAREPGAFTVALQIDDPARAEQLYAALAEGGQQTVPIAETFWAHRFGMLTDRFGTPWMVNCQKAGIG